MIIRTIKIERMSAIQRRLFRLSVLLALLCSVNIVSAQNYQTLNHRIDSLIDIGLPKSALNEVDKLDQLARKEKNAPMQIKAVIYRMTFQSYLEENAIDTIITVLKHDIDHSDFPVKPVLQSLLANIYYQHYQGNRWQFSQRSHLEKPSDDFTKWDLQTIINETGRLYLASLSDVKREQETSVDVLDGVLTGEKTTRYLRPTLYDFLLHRALDFFLADEPALTKPKLAFTINDPIFFGDSQTFADLKIQTTDTSSTYYIGLQLLQQASLFHIQHHHDEALANLDLRRISFLHGKSTLPDNDSHYTTALKNIASTFSSKPISTDALVALANFEQQKDSLQTAVQYAQKAASSFPESLGGINAEILMKEIRKKELSVAVENENMPGEPILAKIQYRNIQKVSYKIFHLTEAQFKQYEDRKRTNYSSNKEPKFSLWFPLFLKNIESTKPIELQLPDPQDYHSHSAELKLEAMNPGNYLIWIENKQLADSSLIHYTDFKVSKIAYISRRNPSGRIEVLVMDRKTGEPLKNARVFIFKYKNRNEARVVKNGFTDQYGRFITNNTKRESLGFQIIYENDTLTNHYKYINLNYNYYNNEKRYDKTVIFTDRQIYRPGQTIFFKGLQLNVFKEKASIKPNKDVEVEFMDANYKQLSTLKLKSNDFGTYNGSFVIPLNILNGNVTLKTKYGGIAVKVEEYKRNSFQVAFLPVNESYKLNDSIKIKGTVKAFSGYGLSQARVVYHISRTQSQANIYRNFYKGPVVTEIKTDTIKTDDQGNIQIKFKAEYTIPENPKDLIYSYSISCDVTDGSGETHSANILVKVGDNNIDLSTNIPQEYMVQDTARIAVGINNLNGRPQKGSLSVEIYVLNGQIHLFKNRLWDKPDQFIMDKKEFNTLFPYYAYANEDDYKTWPIGQQVSKVSFQINDTVQSYFNLWSLKNQPSGVYKIIVRARNDKGDTTSVIQYVNLKVDHPIPLNFDKWVVPVHNIVKAGSEAEFLIGIDKPVNVLMEKYIGKRIVGSKWLNIPKGQQTIKIPISEKDKDVNVQFMMMSQNRVYSSYQNIQIIKPEKGLKIKMGTYRDILQPGDKEQWKLQISSPENQRKAAEMVATLYDASLDDFAPTQDWMNILSISQSNHEEYYKWNSKKLITANNTQPLVNKHTSYVQKNRIYENLNTFGYIYYGGYNNGYNFFTENLRRRLQTARIDKRLEEEYFKNAALVKDGVEISGKITDSSDGQSLLFVTIGIMNPRISTTSNSSGNFRIKVPVNGKLKFSYIGYNSKEIIVTKADTLHIALDPSSTSLDEVVVVGYGKRTKASVRFTPPVIAEDVDKQLEGRVAGVMVGASGRNKSINIRGNSSITTANQPIYVIDGVVIENFNPNMLSPSDIESMTVLKGEDATSLYGSKAVNGVIIIKTKNGFKPQPIQIQTRKNFNETAFFYPQLRTDENGEILIDFTIPEALTKWRFKAFAHTKDLQTGYLERMIVTQKQLSISANMPRFLREGDSITLSARLVNLTTTPLKGKVQIQLFNALNMQPVSLLINAKDEKQNFDLAASTNKAISFRLFIPAGLEALTYKLTADAGQFTDGEENTLPVLPNRMLVTESMPMMVRPGQERSFTFDKLINQNSNTLKSKTLTLEYTQNPVWYAIQAMPYMMEFPYECSEQIFSRYYANSLASNLVNKFPVIKQVFDQWKNSKSPELLSNLEKNPELKEILLEETPWLQDAMNESEQKKRIALLFDLNKMSYELKQNLDKLEKKQLSGGAFPWFGGEYPDRYITQHILEGIGQLTHLNVADAKNQTLKSITDKALNYLDKALIEDANIQKKYKSYEDRSVSSMEIHSYFIKSYFTSRKENTDNLPLLANYLQLAEKQWVGLNIYEQAMIALTMQRNNKPEVAQMIIHSLNETAQHSDDMGMYWAKNMLGYYWYQSPIETQSLMIELFTEAGNDLKAVEEMKIWLLRNKQTTNWKTTKATSAACYALLMKGENWLENSGPSVIKLGGKSLEELKPDVKADVGTGYIKTAWTDEQIKPALSKVDIQNNGKTISWGAIHWQYLENLDKIPSSKTDIQLERKYFIQKQTDTGPVLTAVDAQHLPHTGDLLKVVVYLKAGRDFEYVQLKDMRPSGTEPIDVISSFKFQDGLYYYQVTKDVATNFFISNLAKGSYVFEYRLRVVQPGNFSTGITSVQSMYAPEFNAHSEGARMLIRPN